MLWSSMGVLGLCLGLIGLCLGVLGATPDYGCREIVLVASALATRDAGDLGDTCERLKRAGVRVHAGTRRTAAGRRTAAAR